MKGIKTMPETPHIFPFVEYLIKQKDNRGMLASLRRGLGQPAGTVADMYPYVVPWLPLKTNQLVESAYYLLASLFAAHPSICTNGNMGAHMRAAIRNEGNEQATERRFVALLSSHPEDLPVHLRQAISYLRSKEQPVNWNQLLDDLLHWDHPDRYIQKRWAGSFWLSIARSDVPEPPTESTEPLKS
jgi:CRISPR system Cascade subunit CasB